MKNNHRTLKTSILSNHIIKPFKKPKTMEKLLFTLTSFFGLEFQAIEISSDKDMRIVILLILISITAMIASGFFFFPKKREASFYFGFLGFIGTLISTTFAILNFTFVSPVFLGISMIMVIFSIIIMISALSELRKSFSIFSILYYLLALVYFFMIYKF